MHPVLQVLSAVAPLAAALILRTDHRMVGALRDAGAKDASGATPLTAANGFARWRLERLIGVGVVRESGAARYFLDEARLAAFRRTRRRRVLGAAGAVLLGMAGLRWGGYL